MKTSHSTLRTLLIGITLSLTAAACGSEGAGDPTEGNSYLTVVGDSNVFLEYGVQRVLTVRYHDSDDQPLAGQIGFEIRGDGQGATIGSTSGVTNSNGIAEITVSAGNAETAFEIEATAVFSRPAVWNVAVSSGAPPLALQGSYDLDSKFDVASGLPNGLGDAVNTIIDMTDGPNDPATYLLDILEDELSSPFDDIVRGARPGLDAFVNDEIKTRSPNLINDLIAISNNLGEVSRNFGTDSVVAVLGSSVEGNMSATHTMTGFNFRIDGLDYGFTNADLGVDDVTIENIVVSMANGKVSIGAHNMPIQYGGFLAMALEEVIVPLIDPAADGLGSLLNNLIPCDSVGAALSDFLPLGSAGFYEGVCIQAVAVGADLAIDALIDIDDSKQVVLQISGEARVNDTTGDRNVDKLTQGKWDGAIEYVGESGALEPNVNTFSGTRR